MSYGLVLIPFLSAMIGWLSNRMLTWLMFHPKEPKQILWLTLQGYFPKQQGLLAEKLGKLVSEELFSFRNIGEKIAHPDNFRKLMPVAEEHVDHFLRVKLPQQMPMIGMLIGERTIGEMKTVFLAELESLFPIIMKGYMDGLIQETDIQNLVSAKLAAISPDRVETAFRNLAGKGIQKAAIFSAVIGFLIGVLQVFTVLCL